MLLSFSAMNNNIIEAGDEPEEVADIELVEMGPEAQVSLLLSLYLLLC